MPTTLIEGTTERGRELARLAPQTRRLHAATDREVLLAGRRAKLAENAATAERWLCFVEFYRRGWPPRSRRERPRHTSR